MKNRVSVILAILLLPSLGQAAEPEVKPAALFDLAKVEGLNKFTGPEAGKPLLAERGLLISPETRPQVFHFYYGGELPYFITTDAALHAYGVILEKGFKELEGKQSEVLAEFQAGMWRMLVEGHDGTSPIFANQAPWPEALQTPAATMVAVAAKLLNPQWKPETDVGQKLYERIAGDVEAELKRIENGQPEKSPLFGATVDYSLFQPRGFYARDTKLRLYFKARTFWAMPMDLDDDRVLQTAAVLGTLCEGYDYGRLIEPFEELVGSPNLPAAVAVAGELGFACRSMDVVSFMRLLEDSEAAEARKKLRAELPVPLVPIGADLRQVLEDAFATPQERPLRTAMWPQVAVPDAVMMARCIWPQVPVMRYPGGLDVLASCGSDRALAHLLAAEPEANRKPLETIIKDIREEQRRHWVEGRLFDLQEATSQPDRAMPDLEDLWYARVWGGLERVFETLCEPGLTKSHPKFMSTTAYADKSLNAALSAWATYRHTFVLHAANLGGALGGPGPQPAYVEPNLRFWTTMLDVAMQSYLWLHEQGVEAPQMIELAQLCKRAETIAKKQLAGRKLSTMDEAWLENFGMRLAHLCGYETNMLDEVKEECGIVADIASDRLEQNVLYVATARPRAIYVIMDYGGKFQLARGGVMSYREFVRPLEQGRLTDSQWQDMLKADKEPPAPAWLAAVGADYTAESLLVAVKEGRVNGDVLDRYATKEILAAMLDLCAERAERNERSSWPPDDPKYILSELIGSHPEFVDKAFVERYISLAERHGWPVNTLPRKVEWLDSYIEVAGRLAKLDEWPMDSCWTDIASVIGRIDTPKAYDWLRAALTNEPIERRLRVAWAFWGCQAELSETALGILTDCLLADLEAELTKETDETPETEAVARCREILYVIARLWPYWTFKEDEESLFGDELPDKPVQYAPSRAAIRDRVVAGLKRLAERMKEMMERKAEKKYSWVDESMLEEFARCLGPEAMKTPLAEQIRKCPRALRYAATGNQ